MPPPPSARRTACPCATLEADRAGARPGNHGALLIGDGHDRVVEGRMHMRDAFGHVATHLLATRRRGRRSGGSGSGGRRSSTFFFGFFGLFYFFSHFFFSANPYLR